MERKRPALSVATCFLSVATAISATEPVYVTKVMDDKAIITRRNGESYLIEKGVGCLSLWLYEGKTVLIVSPGLFLGVGSKLIIPERDQQCRIWDSELLSAPKIPPADPEPVKPAPDSEASDHRIVTIQKALRFAGYVPGQPNGSMGPQMAAAFHKYRASKGYPLTEEGIRKTLSSLAVDVAAKNPGNQEALRISLELIALVSEPSPGTDPSGTAPPGSLRAPCSEGHWISSVLSNGELIKLEDGSIWEISAIDRIDTALWLTTEEVTVCGDHLINKDTGDSVDATRIK